MPGYHVNHWYRPVAETKANKNFNKTADFFEVQSKSMLLILKLTKLSEPLYMFDDESHHTTTI